MAIEFKCSACSKTVKGSEKLSGQQVKCPYCQGVITVPAAVYEAEEVPAAIPAPAPAAVTSAPAPFQFDDAAPESADPNEPRRPCPMCGEMILLSAVKCRFCGEIFDKILSEAAATPKQQE